MLKKIVNNKLLLTFLLGGITFLCTAQKLESVKLQINSSSNEMAPFVKDSVLYFISNRKKNVLDNIFNQDKQHLYHIYQAPLLKDGTTGNVSLFKTTCNSHLQSGPITFSNNRGSNIITQYKIKSISDARKRSQKIPLGLFQSKEILGNGYDTYEQIRFSENSDYSFAHPSLSPDGEKLFFISDKEGGYGETDIYMSTKTAEGWGEPVNLGETINTKGKELFPYIHPTGRLYFSSNGHDGIGGIDIYSSTYEGEWKEPKPLEAPINSQYDDFSCFINPEETSGYFASNREGNDNIYHYFYKIDICENPQEVIEENYCFTFFEETATHINSDTLKYQWEFSDGYKAEGIETEHCFPGPGVYQISLNVIDVITGEQQYNVASYELPIEKPQQVYFTLPEGVKSNQAIVIKAALTGFDDAEKIEYFWDFGDNEKQIGETITHIFQKKGKYRIICEACWGQNQKICSYRIVTVE